MNTESNLGIYKTSQGLKYAVDKDIYNQIYSYSLFHHGTHGNCLELFEWWITVIELFPAFCTYLAFVLCAFQTNSVLKICVIATGVYLISTLLIRTCPYWICMIANLPMLLYNLLTKFFVDWIVLLALSVFVWKTWYLFLVYILLKAILHTLYSFSYGSYAGLASLHNKLGEIIINSMPR